jgi:hypothetical protein
MSSEIPTFIIEHSIAKSSTPFNSASWCDNPSEMKD